MIIEFQFGNFRSFKDLQTFSMRAANKRKDDSGMEEEHVFEAPFDLWMLKTKAIYGSNASGKSNIAKAFGAFRSLVKSSVLEEDLTKRIWEDRFRLNKDNDGSMMSFQLIFSFEKNIFRYGFEVNQGIIKSEWLYSSQINHLEEEDMYFVRKELSLHYNENHFSKDSIITKSIDDGDNEIFRRDSLFLTSAAIIGNKNLAIIRNEILKTNAVDNTFSESGLEIALHILDQGEPKEKKALNDFLKYADTGINDLSFAEFPYVPKDRRNLPEEFPQNSRLKTLISSHVVYDNNNNQLNALVKDNILKWESKGSIKLLGLAGIILKALKYGETIIIDEFDASLHPNLSLKIIQLFHSNETNPNHAQLIIITHDEGLMKRGELRHDQIVFVNKDEFGKSSIKTLIEYKGIRKDHAFDKEYLEGSYAAIPNLVKLDLAVTNYLN